MSSRASGCERSSPTSRSGEDELTSTGVDSPSVQLQNPMNTARDRMRTSLRPWGLQTFALNQRETRGSLGLFEVGKTFKARRASQPTEERMLLALLGGDAIGSVHGDPARSLDFYDIKGVMEQLGSGLGRGIRSDGECGRFSARRRTVGAYFGSRSAGRSVGQSDLRCGVTIRRRRRCLCPGVVHCRTGPADSISE